MRLINADTLVDYLRNGVHATKAAIIVDKFAESNPVEAVAIGDRIPDGIVMQIMTDEKKPWARLVRKEINND